MWWLCAALACLMAACGAPASDSTIVFAAASLRDALEPVGESFDGGDVVFNFAGSGRLALQIEDGAPADVFASADVSLIEDLRDEGLVSKPVTFATNRLAIAVASGNPLGLRGLGDLARDDVTVVLAAPDVPAGAYARRALANARVNVNPVSEELDVRAVLAKVALGEADAGLVYASDVQADGSVGSVTIAAEHNVTVRYAAAAVSASPAGQRFLRHLLSESSRATLRRFGFGAP